MKRLVIAVLAAILLAGCASNQATQRGRSVDAATAWECKKVITTTGKAPNACR